MKTLQGQLKREISKNEYGTIFSLLITKTDHTNLKQGDSIVVKTNGEFDYVDGLDVSCQGAYIEDKKYGTQFSAKSISIIEVSNNLINLERLNFFKKNNRLIVREIFKKYGDQILNQDDVLKNISSEFNLKPLEASSIKRNIGKLTTVMKAAPGLFYGKHDAKKILVLNNILDKFGHTVSRVINTNPYLLSKIEGVTFKQVDNIVSNSTLQINKSQKAKALLDFIFSNQEKKGNTAVTFESLFKSFIKNMPEVSIDDVERLVDYYSKNGYLHSTTSKDEVVVSTNENREFSKSIAKDLKRLSESNGSFRKIPYASRSELNEGQNNAVRKCINNKVSILTGGPGTGKTTTLKTILSAITEKNPDMVVKLCAPTGKAAIRMEESTGYEASTIHSLLKSDSDSNFEHNHQNQLDADLIVVDESSMMGEYLTSKFLSSIKDTARVIFIGDPEQLPSVEGGDVLNDMIKSNRIPTAKLTEVMRQSSESGKTSEIITFSQSIIDKTKRHSIDLNTYKNNEVTWIDTCRPSEDKADKDKKTIDILNKVLVKLIDGLKVSPDEIQILTPRKGTSLGVDNINKLMRDHFNPDVNSKYSVQRYGKEYFVNDRVIFTKNDYKLGVSNGDIGTIDYIDMKNYTAKIRLQRGIEKESIEINHSDFDMIDLAYAKTVHKSQGSEYKYVILPIMEEHKGMLYPEAIYTAVTRAKEKCILLGEKSTFSSAMKSSDNFKRTTILAYEIAKEFKKQEYSSTFERSNVK